MKIVDKNGKVTHIISWNHDRFIYNKEDDYETKGGKTICTIKTINTDLSERRDIGMASCSLQDVYNKSIGRKKSLAKAIRVFDKDFRKTVWDTYRRECK
jgi:hypothetical protein